MPAPPQEYTADLGYLIGLGKWLGAFIMGGGMLRFLQWWTDRDQQEHAQTLDQIEVERAFRDELRRDMDAMRKRLDMMEANVIEERKARLDAEEAAHKLQQKVDLLIRMVNDLRKELSLAPISEDEIR